MGTLAAGLAGVSGALLLALHAMTLSEVRSVRRTVEAQGEELVRVRERLARWGGERAWGFRERPHG